MEGALCAGLSNRALITFIRDFDVVVQLETKPRHSPMFPAFADLDKRPGGGASSISSKSTARPYRADADLGESGDRRVDFGF